MSQTIRYVSSVKASVPEVWATLVRARAFVVSPYISLKARFDRDAELVAGEPFLARLFAGPLALSSPWVIQTLDRDGGRLSVHGAEGFERKLLWDYEILIGEDGPRCIVDYQIKVPRKRSSLGGISIHRMFDRRHIRLRSMLPTKRIMDARDEGSQLPAGPVDYLKQTNSQEAFFAF